MRERACVLFCALLAATSSAEEVGESQCVSETEDSETELIGRQLWSWLRENGAFVDSRLVVRTDPGFLGGKVPGVFATAPLPQHSVLAQIPRRLMIASRVEEHMSSQESYCQTDRLLSAELAKGNASFYWPYLQVLSRHSPELPHYWSEGARSLLRGLPPYDADRHEQFYTFYCKPEGPGRRAIQLQVARAHLDPSGKSCMVPFYDQLNHQEASAAQLRSDWDSDGSMKLTTGVDIAEGEQVFNHYAEDAPDLLRDYGFVPTLEGTRTHWYFQDDNGARHSFSVGPDGQAQLKQAPTAVGSAAKRAGPVSFIGGPGVASEAARRLLARLKSEVHPDPAKGLPADHALALQYRAALQQALESAFGKGSS